MSTMNPIPVWPTGSPRATQLEALLADAAERLLEIAEEAERRKGTPLWLKQEYHAAAGGIARQCIGMKVLTLGLGGRHCKRLAKYLADVEANMARVAQQQSSGRDGNG